MLKLLGLILAVVALDAIKSNETASRQDKNWKRNRSQKSDLSKKTIEEIRVELDRLYQRKGCAHERGKKIQKELSIAYSELAEIKAGLDSWYREANGTWLGNGGQELPKYAFFRQSTNVRDQLKQQRDCLGSTIGRLKSERYDIFNNTIPALKRSIARLKREKQRRSDAS